MLTKEGAFKKRILSFVLVLIIATTSLVSATVTAFAAAMNTPQTATVISLNNATSTTFKYGYPDGTYHSSVYNNEQYFKFTPSATGYYEFNLTGYENTKYAVGETPFLSCKITNAANGTHIESFYTNEYTLLTRGAAQLYSGVTYILEVYNSMSSIASIADYDYGYAEQTINLKATKHNHEYKVDKYVYSTYTRAYYECLFCDYYYSSSFYAPKTVTLSASSYVYNGNVKKPTVKVKDSNGKTISSAYYTLNYSSGLKNVGKYYVTVKFRDIYAGYKDIKKSFIINPKTTSVSKVTAGKKKFTVKWAKQSTQTSGYQIQYSTSSKFKNAKTVTISKNNTTSKTISSLLAKKKYYVRVRTYKTVSGTKYYSSWSKAKSVTTAR